MASRNLRYILLLALAIASAEAQQGAKNGEWRLFARAVQSVVGGVA